MRFDINSLLSSILAFATDLKRILHIDYSKISVQINLCNPLVMLQISTALLETKRGYDKLQDNSEKSKIFLNTCIILKELEQFNFSYSGKMLWTILQM